MISSFDKSGAAKLYKRAFIQNVDDCDYESALDNLLKYHDVVGNDDFHLACGILYFMMSQDSDDNELLVLAAREFMLHLRLYPDCRVAYRDLIGTHMLRHDAAATLACSDWAAMHGFDMNEILAELSEAGVELFGDESMGLDLESLLEPGEFGEIDMMSKNGADSGVNAGANGGKSNILKFRGGSYGGNGTLIRNNGGKIVSIDRQDAQSDLRGDWDDDEFDLQPDDESDLAEEISRELVNKIRNGEVSDNPDVSTQLILHEAEQFCSEGKFDAALSALAEIKPSDERFYYCAECLRSFIYIQTGDYKSARSAIDRAFKIIPHGALACTMLCKIYEDKKQFDKIPEALKNADVKDYTDAGHVYQAMRLAIEYCTPEDAIALAEEYIDEFNTMDIRMLYAQLLYNIGDKKTALREMYKLSRIFYDDFNTRYYYNSALQGAKRMPIDEDAPQLVLSTAVNAFLLVNKEAIPDDDVLCCEEYRTDLELFLTLEYPNDRRISGEMFELLRRLAAEPRLDQRMRDALVSPYVEPIVKAVILSELLKTSDDYLMSLSFCPITSDVYKPFGDEYTAAFKTAYAFTVALSHKQSVKLVELATYYKPLLDVSPFCERDKAFYLLEKLNAACGVKKQSDGRVSTALGFASKSAAQQAVKSIESYISACKHA